MFEAVGLPVDGVDADLERLGKVKLEQSVVAEDFERDLLARLRGLSGKWPR